MSKSSIAISFPWIPVLTLIFITLKLTGYIAWSWWWVLSPLWIPIAAVTVFIILLMLIKSFTSK